MNLIRAEGCAHSRGGSPERIVGILVRQGGDLGLAVSEELLRRSVATRLEGSDIGFVSLLCHGSRGCARVDDLFSRVLGLTSRSSSKLLSTRWLSERSRARRMVCCHDTRVFCRRFSC